MSILSRKPDGVGFFYGFIEGDTRQVNVKPVFAGYDADSNHVYAWEAYVGGDLVATEPSKDEAEAAAIRYAKANPEEG